MKRYNELKLGGHVAFAEDFAERCQILVANSKHLTYKVVLEKIGKLGNVKQ